MRMLFETFDKNGNGFISKREFKKKMKSYIDILGKDVTNEEIMEFFDEIDSNGDGKIDFEEFKATPIMPKKGDDCWCDLVRDIWEWVKDKIDK